MGRIECAGKLEGVGKIKMAPFLHLTIGWI
jgi:hypothetical protein